MIGSKILKYTICYFYFDVSKLVYYSKDEVTELFSNFISSFYMIQQML